METEQIELSRLEWGRHQPVITITNYPPQVRRRKTVQILLDSPCWCKLIVLIKSFDFPTFSCKSISTHHQEQAEWNLSFCCVFAGILLKWSSYLITVLWHPDSYGNVWNVVLLTDRSGLHTPCQKWCNQNTHHKPFYESNEIPSPDLRSNLITI